MTMDTMIKKMLEKNSEHEVNEMIDQYVSVRLMLVKYSYIDLVFST